MNFPNEATYVVYALDEGKTKEDLADLGITPGKGVAYARGSWEGIEEDSYISSVSTFKEKVLPSGLVDNQESFLLLGKPDTNLGLREAWLLWQESGELDDLGYLTPVSAEDAKAAPGWTYRPDQDQYYTVLDFDEAEAAVRKARGPERTVSKGEPGGKRVGKDAEDAGEEV